MTKDIKVVGLENLWRPDYQVAVKQQVNNIFGNREVLSVEDLKNNTIFNEKFQLKDESIREQIFNKIEKLVGDDGIDRYEMQAIYALLDSKSEINTGNDKDTRPQKYVFDLGLNDIGEATGLLKIAKDYAKDANNDGVSDELKGVFDGMIEISKMYEPIDSVERDE